MSSVQTRVVSRLETADRALEQLDELIERLEKAEDAWSDWLTAVSPEHRASATNMVHYWSLRQSDLRDLQRRLAGLGLSSLGRSEPHVEGTLRLVHAAVAAMRHGTWHPPGVTAVDANVGDELLREHAVDLFGPAPAERETRIMVTLPSSAATDPDLVRDLIARGMNVARINCAHDDAEAWTAMAGHVRRAAESTGRKCLVAMDLAGPKLRTGPIQPGPRVIKLRPTRDALGRVVTPFRLRLSTPEEHTGSSESAMAVVPVDEAWLARRRDGDVVGFHDARGAKRQLVLSRPDEMAGAVIATGDKTSYLATGTVLHAGAHDPCEVGLLPEREQTLMVQRGDELTLTRDCAPVPADHGGAPRIGCTLPEVFDHARPGQKIRFDDGRIGGEIIAVERDALRVRIDRTAPGGSKLGSAKASTCRTPTCRSRR